MRELYDTNPDFKAYVDKYCIKHNITVDQALEHYLIKDAAEYYHGGWKLRAFLASDTTRFFVLQVAEASF